ncbi:MAG: FAD-dependent oxidoreductase [Acidobacteriia bacterium]|nr:FAD-dependent oxidoreductase [Terriglobia bacterium]
MVEPHFVILGGGPAGCGAAYQLRRQEKGRVTLVEQSEVLGGNAGSFEVNGIHLDYGSHRLHSACDPEVLGDIQAMLGDDLAHRERRGRILLRGKYVQFPLRAKDLFLRLDRRFALGAGADMIRRAFVRTDTADDSFASVMLANLGRTICEHFYFPYARKIWGRPPESLSGIQARKRVTANSLSKLVKRLGSPLGGGRFYYPRRGFGQISEAYASQARQLGAEILTGWRVTGIRRNEDERLWKVEIRQENNSCLLSADHVWSTLPINVAAGLMAGAPPDVLSAKIEYRAMVLAYLELGRESFTNTDAHYFPEEHVRMTRLSEPKNYFGAPAQSNRTFLCAELPCSLSGDLWTMSDQEIGAVVAEDMRKAGLPLSAPPLQVFTKRLRQAYPIYTIGYEEPLHLLDAWMQSLPNFVTYGRQGLFAHDNTHHALFMAYCAVKCVKDGVFDAVQWRRYREEFATHVVED